MQSRMSVTQSDGPNRSSIVNRSSLASRTILPGRMSMGGKPRLPSCESLAESDEHLQRSKSRELRSRLSDRRTATWETKIEYKLSSHNLT